MKPFTGLLLAILIAAAAGGCAQDTMYIQANSYKTPHAARIKTVAVVDFAGECGQQAIADILTMNLFLAGYDVVERKHLQSLITEKKLAKRGFKDLSDVEKAKSLGKILNADAIITGSLIRIKPPRYSKQGEDRLTYESAVIELSARAIDTKTGKVFWTCVINATSNAETGQQLKIMNFINEPCAELVYSLKAPDYPSIGRTYKGAAIEARRRERGF